MAKSRAKIYEEERAARAARRTANSDFILHNHLRELREARYLSQAELADFVGVCKSTISMWEHETKGIKDRNKLELCIILKCSVNELFDWEA